MYRTVTGPWDTIKQMAHVVSAFSMLVFERGNETNEQTANLGVRGPEFMSCSVDVGLKSTTTTRFSGLSSPSVK